MGDYVLSKVFLQVLIVYQGVNSDLKTEILSLPFQCDLKLQVGKAVEHIAAGTTALQKAKTLQRSTRKCMCIAIIILLVTATIVVVAVVQPWKKAT